MNDNMKVCRLGIWDNTIPGIRFDQAGISNYAHIQKKMMADFPRGNSGQKDWDKIVKSIREKRGKKEYDCIVGVSGGTDSSYLLHILKKYELRPLAVNLDNGWSSEIAVANIKKMTQQLGIDLETYVIDYEEIKDLMRCYMFASVPWIDAPTDLAIHSILYLIAKKERVNYIFVGQDFRSEGKQPTEWTYSDQKQLKYFHKQHGRVKLKSFPLVSLWKLFYFGYIKKIKLIPVFSFIDHQKKYAQEFLKKKYNWCYYGEHHHENLFSKFAIGHWQYKKFGIDKRIITYSAQILSGEISRNDAIQEVENAPYKAEDLKNDLNYILNKLELSKEEYNRIWYSPNCSFKDYPSYYPIFVKLYKYVWPIVSKIVPTKPKIFYEFDERSKD
tara:strand:- start:1654 stop:2811 length:1158 start_codon:yes stop_codon:yes gene_type:complete